ncbi:2-hydroxyacid dehydrogenase [Desertibacillus haloalkaliphilus]|uniref:2-hydroxyacid dehydrogenase n=1 Tax=Desertibacillus haloalkaliphilus TaxID=1328930 RepID=UPI001C255229|nr:D-glycerate dehydrogenase [Desertibacillus haloalkaliphilus]MBU8907689.1 D-glycerate dehydrogenase [Desertibacillus haloalkaliphilus]
MKPKVFIEKPIPKEVEELISQHCHYRMWDKEEKIPHEVLLKEVADVDGLLTPKGKITKEFLEHAPNLKVVSNMAVGYDAFDLKAMEERGVLGTHTPYVLDDTVADLAFSLVLSTARRLPELDQYVKQGKWVRDEEFFFGVDVHHATLGIIGLGRIGEKVARRAALGFDMDVLYYNRSRRREVEETLGIHYTDLPTLLAQSDFILVMVPLTNETYHLIGEKHFELMKRSAIFINCSRGKTVDEQALVKALQQEKIKGAGLDVYDVEPIDVSHPLLQMPNVVTLPHIGSATKKTRDDMALKGAENLVAAVTGNIPENIVPELKHLI